ncbi:hypothetical protein BJV78DRAFT_1282892 [Lactifluus subvellereus]|nr:hypothetical protein BJV78DRAFT_1282892 [Lactifluus subvellereus]
MSVYDPYIGRFRTPSAWSYSNYSYSPFSQPFSTYGDDYYYPAGSRGLSTSYVSERVYYSLNGKLIRSYKIRNYKRAQRHVLDLFPDVLQGVASSRIQFYVTRAGYSHGQYVGFKSYISKHAWLTEIDSLAEHETLCVEVRPSISVTESISSFFNRGRFF